MSAAAPEAAQRGNPHFRYSIGGIMTHSRFSLAIAILLALTGGNLFAQEMPELPKPQKEHQWLSQLAGEWNASISAKPGPGAPEFKAEAKQSSKMIGDRWLMATSEGDMMGQKMTSILTLGYDPSKKEYVGSFLSSCGNELWTYEGAVSDDGKTLVLKTEGPNMMNPGATSEYRETITLKDKDHYTFTSAIKGEDGKFVEFMTAEYVQQK
jgi:hypothetical protein